MSALDTLRILFLALGVLIAALLWLTPALSRPEIYFAVTVAAEFRASAVGLAILRRYRRELAAVSVLALTAVTACCFGAAVGLAPLALLTQLAGSFLVFYRARARVRPHAIAPTSIREAQTDDRPPRIPGRWPAACGPFLVLAACAGCLWLRWQRIPARFPVHWSAGGIPDRWVARTPIGVYQPLLLVAAVLVPLTLLLYGMTHWVRPIRAAGTAGARESRFRRTAAVALLTVEYGIALQASWIALHPLLPDFLVVGPAGTVALLLPLAVVLAVVIALARLGQGGSRSAPEGRRSQQRTVGQPVGDQTEDGNWLLGVFYFNRDDPSVLIEKRFGIGYTLNFARPISWVIIIAVLLLPLTFILLRHA
jgi:uncharacterized membrane protein